MFKKCSQATKAKLLDTINRQMEYLATVLLRDPGNEELVLLMSSMLTHRTFVEIIECSP